MPPMPPNVGGDRPFRAATSCQRCRAAETGAMGRAYVKEEVRPSGGERIVRHPRAQPSENIFADADTASLLGGQAVEHEVFIIDDDRLSRWALGKVLVRAGYRVREAGTAEEGLAGIQKAAPHLVFLDMHLPDQDGLSVLHLLQELRPTLPVVVISADLPLGEARRLCQAGAQGCLAKPCAPSVVIALTESLLSPPARLDDVKEALWAEPM